MEFGNCPLTYKVSPAHTAEAIAAFGVWMCFTAVWAAALAASASNAANVFVNFTEFPPGP
jgi:hypothetical protein